MGRIHIIAKNLFEVIEKIMLHSREEIRPSPEDQTDSDMHGGGREVLDMEEVLERIGGDTKLLRDIAELFLEKIPGLLLRVKEAAIRSDPKALERNAHTIKGSASNLAAKAVCEAALKLEEMGRFNDLTKVGEAVASLEVEIERLQMALLALKKDLGIPKAGSNSLPIETNDSR
jgi:HPt (histidine-containing phosphotransfer) domain-containing protein